MIEIGRGCIGHSEDALAERWKWSRGKVRRFLNELKKDRQILQIPVQQNPRLTCLISIVNYDAYQTDGTTDGTTDGQQTVQEQERKERKEKKKKKIIVFSLPDYIPQETWESYLAVRVKKRAAQTPYALNLVIMELEKIKATYGHDPVLVLNKSITSGWSDVYPLRDGQATVTTQLPWTAEEIKKMEEGCAE